jgi:hypothetical protein
MSANSFIEMANRDQPVVGGDHGVNIQVFLQKSCNGAGVCLEFFSGGFVEKQFRCAIAGWHALAEIPEQIHDKRGDASLLKANGGVLTRVHVVLP